MTGIVLRNPCPVCGNPCHLMAGVNVRGGDFELRYLVCWRDGSQAAVCDPIRWRIAEKHQRKIKERLL